MKLFSIILILLISTNSYGDDVGGMNFTHIWNGDYAMDAPEEGNFLYYIPHFKDISAAVSWAHKVRYVPAIYERILIKKENTAIIAIMNQHPRNKEDEKLLLQTLNDYQCYKIIASIMERYRDDGINGDMAMSYTLPKFKSERYGIEWAKAVKGSPIALRNVMEEMIRLQRLARPREGGKGLVEAQHHDILMKQWEVLNKMKEIIEADQKNGSSFYAGSVPIGGYK